MSTNQPSGEQEKELGNDKPLSNDMTAPSLSPAAVPKNASDVRLTEVQEIVKQFGKDLEITSY